MPADNTFNGILQRMLSRIITNNPNIDIREGSMIYNAVAPEALELAIAYDEMQNVLNESFITTASREYKIKKAQEVGIDTTEFDATAAIMRGEFNQQITVGSRWNLDLYNYTCTADLGQNESALYEYELTCEQLGGAPNTVTGDLTPIDVPPAGLTIARIVGVIISGRDEFTNSEIDEYYNNRVNGTISDGNVAQYEQWLLATDGVGKFRIFSLGLSDMNSTPKNNYVELCVLQEDGSPFETYPADDKPHPENGLFRLQQQYDPAFKSTDGDGVKYTSRGMGNGQAPIGALVDLTTATVHVCTVTCATVNGSATIPEDLRTAINAELDKYAKELAFTSPAVSGTALNRPVNVYDISAIILGVDGVSEITGVTLYDGSTPKDSVPIADHEIPSVTLTANA